MESMQGCCGVVEQLGSTNEQPDSQDRQRLRRNNAEQDDDDVIAKKNSNTQTTQDLPVDHKLFWETSATLQDAPSCCRPGLLEGACGNAEQEVWIRVTCKSKVSNVRIIADHNCISCLLHSIYIFRMQNYVLLASLLATVGATNMMAREVIFFSFVRLERKAKF